MWPFGVLPSKCPPHRRCLLFVFDVYVLGVDYALVFLLLAAGGSGPAAPGPPGVAAAALAL